MNITIDIQTGHIVVAIIGDLDNAASSQAERSLAPIFEHDDCDVVIDCSELNYISSSGLRLLIGVYKPTRANGKETILKGLSAEVAEVFNLSGFLQLFKILK